MTGIPRRWILDEYRRPFLCPIPPIVVWNLWHLLRDAASTVDNVDTEPHSFMKILCRLGQIIRRVYSWQHCAHLCRRSGWCYWWSWLHKGGLLLQKSRTFPKKSLLGFNHLIWKHYECQDVNVRLLFFVKSPSLGTPTRHMLHRHSRCREHKRGKEKQEGDLWTERVPLSFSTLMGSLNIWGGTGGPIESEQHYINIKGLMTPSSLQNLTQ